MLMKKALCSALSILEINKIVVHKFSCDYMKPKYRKKKAKLCCVDTDNFIVNIKTKDMQQDIAEGVDARFDTSNYELERALPMEKKILD